MGLVAFIMAYALFAFIFYIMGFSLLSEMEFFAVPKNGISLNI